jgi:outer membrane protein assembly factor BamD
VNDRSWINIVSFGMFDKQELRGFDTRAKYNPTVTKFDEPMNIAAP